jgi:hypothetical protein
VSKRIGTLVDRHGTDLSRRVKSARAGALFDGEILTPNDLNCLNDWNEFNDVRNACEGSRRRVSGAALGCNPPLLHARIRRGASAEESPLAHILIFEIA